VFEGFSYSLSRKFAVASSALERPANPAIVAGLEQTTPTTALRRY